MTSNLKSNPLYEVEHLIYEDKDGEKTVYCLYPKKCKVCR